MMTIRVVSVSLAASLLLACGTRDPYAGQVRGHGLAVDSLPPAEVASIYTEAASGSFNQGTPLMLDPRYLPRTAGWTTGETVPGGIRTALYQAHLVQGTCSPQLGDRAVPVCESDAPGYVVRFSPVFRVSTDTVEVYLGVTKYRTSSDQPAEALRFEKAYQVVRRGGTWRVAREGRMPPPY